MRTLALAVLMTGCIGEAPADGSQLQLEPAALKDRPVAVGTKLRLDTQSNVRPGLFQFANVEATLELTGPDGATLATTSTGVGELEAVFPAAGDYTLKARTDTAHMELTVHVKEIAALTLLSPRVSTLIEGGAGCSSVPAAGTITLRANQYLELGVGATTAEGEALLGILDVTALDLGVTVNRPILDDTPNRYVITPRGTGDGRVEFTERTTGKTVVQPLVRDGAMAACP